MIDDPIERGRALATFHAAVTPRLWSDLEGSGLLPADAPEARARRRHEWECLALHACLRGLVAASGFSPATAAAVDAFHRAVLEDWMAEDAAGFDARRLRVADRYAEYGALAQEAPVEHVGRRLAGVAARHMGLVAPDEELVTMLGVLHETLAEGAAEAVRRGTSAPS